MKGREHRMRLTVLIGERTNRVESFWLCTRYPQGLLHCRNPGIWCFSDLQGIIGMKISLIFSFVDNAVHYSSVSWSDMPESRRHKLFQIHGQCRQRLCKFDASQEQISISGRVKISECQKRAVKIQISLTNSRFKTMFYSGDSQNQSRSVRHNKFRID